MGEAKTTHTIEYTTEEGGYWKKAETAWTYDRWRLFLYMGGDPGAFAIRFDNGRIWDTYLGCFRDEYRPMAAGSFVN